MKIKPTAPGRRIKAPLFTIVGGVVLINPAYAQNAPPAGLEEVIVTGMRVSLRQSMEIKRDSTGVVDAINAEDIGRFPNTNVAESLQRIPGVAIDRQNGEGAQVTVRGFGPEYNLVTLNGRTVPTAEVNVWGNRDNFAGAQGRSFDFSNIASEGVSSLEVFKTGQAILPSGGIGATINVNTLRPFDAPPGTQAVFGAKAIIDTSVEEGDEVTPELSGLFNWTNDDRTLGFGVFGAYAQRDSSAAIGQTNDWVVRRAGDFFADTSIVRAGGDPNNYQNAPAAGELFAIPQDSRYDASDLSRERINGQVVVQFRPTDSMTLTADYSYFANENEELRYEQTNWFATPFDQLVFDGNGTVSQALLHAGEQRRQEGHGLRADQPGAEGRARFLRHQLRVGSDGFRNAPTGCAHRLRRIHARTIRWVIPRPSSRSVLRSSSSTRSAGTTATASPSRATPSTTRAWATVTASSTSGTSVRRSRAAPRKPRKWTWTSSTCAGRRSTRTAASTSASTTARARCT